MRLLRLNAVVGFFLTAILSVIAWGSNPPLPGTVNYIEGNVSIGAEALNPNSIGSVQLQAGESLSTENGRAEILLTPGVFLRVGDDSLVKMVSPSLTNTEVSVSRGQAMVEVNQIRTENDIRVVQNDASTKLLKTGLYDFDARQEQVRVFEGEAMVRYGDHQVKVKGGHEVNLNTRGQLKAEKFDKRAYQGDLYRFSSLRSSYLAEANTQVDRVYIDYGWIPEPGWWWNPWLDGYTFIPMSGVFYSPFGWGFYPAWAIPFYGPYPAHVPPYPRPVPHPIPRLPHYAYHPSENAPHFSGSPHASATPHMSAGPH